MILEVNNLSFSYSKKEILNNVSFKLDEGEIVTILGKNGVGKTTLLEILLSIKKAKTGSIILNNKNLEEYSSKDKAKLIAYVPQILDETSLTVFDFLLLGRMPYFNMFPSKEDKEEVFKIIKEFNLEEIANHSMTEVSGGERQLVSIARTMLTKPKILILDEPTSALDVQNTKKVLHILETLVKRENVSILISMHDINEALAISNRLLMFKEGSILFDIKPNMISENVIYETYGVNSKLIKRNEKLFIDFYGKD